MPQGQYSYKRRYNIIKELMSEKKNEFPGLGFSELRSKYPNPIVAVRSNRCEFTCL